MVNEVEALVLGKSFDRIVNEYTVGKIQVQPWMFSHGQAVRL